MPPLKNIAIRFNPFGSTLIVLNLSENLTSWVYSFASLVRSGRMILKYLSPLIYLMPVK